MRPLHVFQCRSCGHVVYPRRLACPRCHESAWTEVEVEHGIIEQVTTRMHRTYEEKRQVIGGWTERTPVPLAAVRTDRGPVVTARLPAELEVGTVVRLFQSSGAAVAEPLDELP